MSRVSGKCDLLDWISGLGGWYDKDGNEVKMGQEGVSVYYSDLMQDFIAFKKMTGGVIHQWLPVKVTEYNKEYVKNHCSSFDFIEHEEIKKDKRTKAGERKAVSYTYTYYGKEYKSLKELNRREIHVEKDIHFDTLLDLVPFFPYLVMVASFDKEKSYIQISSQSYVDRCFQTNMWESSDKMCDYYRQELSSLTKDIVIHYFLEGGEKKLWLK